MALALLLAAMLLPLLGIMGMFLSFALAEPWWSTTGIVVAFLLLGMFFDMTLRMALQAIYMSTTREAVMATQFTIYMTLGNMSNVVGSAIITPLDALFSSRSIFVSSAVLGIVPLLLLYWLPTASAVDEPAEPEPASAA